MKKVSLLLFVMLAVQALSAQESNNGKKLWAKSVLNQKAPELVVGEWLTDKPETEGKFVLVDFWATWCGPCRKLIPEMNEWSKQFKDDLVVIGIAGQTREDYAKYTVPEIEYFVALDSAKRMQKELEVTGIPHVILIDPQGIVRWEGYPALPGENKLTTEVIERLIKKYKAPAEKKSEKRTGGKAVAGRDVSNARGGRGESGEADTERESVFSLPAGRESAAGAAEEVVRR